VSRRRAKPPATLALRATLTPRQIQCLRASWRLGQLRWLLKAQQDAIYESVWTWITDPECLTGCLNISRQFGKTFALLLIAVELCIRKPGAQVRFAAPTGLEMRKRTLPIMRTILRTCPPDWRPRWNGQDKCYTWPNGSQLHIAGVNNDHADDLRGAACDLAIIDEGGFCDEFMYLVNSILLPQTLTTRGTLIASSTPPRTLAHEYHKFAKRCMQDGHYLHRDIYASDLDEKQIALYAETCGGFDSTTFKREHLAMFVVDETLAIIPDWSPTFVRAHDAESPARQFWHNYSAMDIGESRQDWTAVLFGHYNFLEARLYIEDELIDRKLPRMTTVELAQEVREIERRLWGSPRADAPPPQPYKRIADNNAPELLVDLAIHGVPFHPTSKDELYAMVNNVRVWVKRGRIAVHPRCKNLLACLQLGIWKDEDHIGREFDRNDECGHLDALAALIYLVRGVNTHTNPVPDNWGIGPQDFASPRRKQDPNTAALKGLFGNRRRVK